MLKGTRHEWQIFFFISAGLFSFGGIIFAIFARGEVQEWAKVKADVVETLVHNEKDSETTKDEVSGDNNNDKATIALAEKEALMNGVDTNGHNDIARMA